MTAGALPVAVALEPEKGVLPHTRNMSSHYKYSRRLRFAIDRFAEQTVVAAADTLHY